MTRADKIRATHLRLIANRTLQSRPAGERTEPSGEPSQRQKEEQAYADLERALAAVDALQADDEAQEQATKQADNERVDGMHQEMCAKLDAVIEAVKAMGASLDRGLAAVRGDAATQAKAIEGMSKTQAQQIKGLETCIDEVVTVLKAPVVPEFSKDGTIKAAVRKL